MSIGMADTYTSSVRDDDAAVALIHRALDLGVTFLDTADVYGVSEIQGIALVAYSPLSRGFLAGRLRKPEDLAPDDWRRNKPAVPGGELPQEPGARGSRTRVG